MPDLWYYARNDQRHGPVPLLELRRLASSGSFDATDLVWSPGMADWVPAANVDGLFSGRPSTVAAFPIPAPSAVADVPVADDRWYYEHEGERCEPVSFQELQRVAASGQVQPDNLVWKRGMAEWTPAGQVDGLFPSHLEPAAQPADLWYYGDGEQRHGPVSMNELKALASSGQLQPSHLVWKRGMAEWAPAAQIDGLFPFRAESSLRSTSPANRKPLTEPVSTPSPKERTLSIRDVTSPQLSQDLRAIRASPVRISSFIHRQHFGTRLRLLIAATARGINWCYNAARPHVIRAWNKRPSKEQVRDWSAAKAQQASVFEPVPSRLQRRLLGVLRQLAHLGIGRRSAASASRSAISAVTAR